MLKKLKDQGKTAFIPFIVVGDPDLETSGRAVDILIEEGADLIELGVPFSDAFADGPVIQAASERAAQKTSLQAVLHFATEMGLKHPQYPFVVFTYYNPIFKMGLREFSRRAALANIYAVLVVDLPPEEAKEYSLIMAEAGLRTVFLASPTTPKNRLQEIGRASTGFIYYVSRTGVTGTQSEVSTTLAAEIAEVRRLTAQPLAVGFGVSNGEQASQIAQLGDAVVVGSAFVKRINEDSQGLASFRALAREIRTATLSKK
ncbi:MAG: tryptophan synthase subunit alpha [Bdellovibrionales bacterium]|nr:tryptophan synthase subunit alpha [Oligoflexia bacterium]